MNTGAFGEGFPYSNFHDLNMDWIIKIAKDFLDQYTHIQETINNGEEAINNDYVQALEDLDTKANELTESLNEWYTEHSADISGELATAIQNFQLSATQIANHVIESIPDDYTDFYNDFVKLKEIAYDYYGESNSDLYLGTWGVGGSVSDGVFTGTYSGSGNKPTAVVYIRNYPANMNPVDKISKYMIKFYTSNPSDICTMYAYASASKGGTVHPIANSDFTVDWTFNSNGWYECDITDIVKRASEFVPLAAYIALLIQPSYASNNNITLSHFECYKNINSDIFTKIPADNIYIENPEVLENYHTNSIYITKTGNVIVIDYQGTGNAWFTYDLASTLLINNFIKISFTIENISGSFRLWMFAKDNNGVSQSIPLYNFTTNGIHTFDVDLNQYAVYNNINLNAPIQFGIGNTSHPSYVKVIDFKGVNVITTLEGDSLLQSLEDINTRSITNEINIEQLTSNKYLIAPDGTKYTVGVDNNGNIIAIPTTPENTLIIGNSLLLGFDLFGMASSNIDSDYYHFIKAKILQTHPSGTVDKLAGYNFENCTTQQAVNTWLTNTLLPMLNTAYDLVIIQLGDNVNTEAKLNIFNTSCKQLITFIRQNCPTAKVCWVGEWYSTTVKQTLINRACLETGSQFVDISTLRTSETESYIGAVINYGTSDSRTYQIDTYTDNQTTHVLTINFTVNNTQYQTQVPYTSYSASENSITIIGTYGFINNTGVASHPGNAGMLAIANKIINELGI